MQLIVGEYDAIMRWLEGYTPNSGQLDSRMNYVKYLDVQKSLKNLLDIYYSFGKGHEAL